MQFFRSFALSSGITPFIVDGVNFKTAGDSDLLIVSAGRIFIPMWFIFRTGAITGALVAPEIKLKTNTRDLIIPYFPTIIAAKKNDKVLVGDDEEVPAGETVSAEVVTPGTSTTHTGSFILWGYTFEVA